MKFDYIGRGCAAELWPAREFERTTLWAVPECGKKRGARMAGSILDLGEAGACFFRTA